MTKEQDKFIIDNFNNMSITKLRKLFNDKFGTNYKESIFYYHTNRLKLTKMKIHKYSKEQDEFLKNNAGSMTREELAYAFNTKFNTSINKEAIEMRCWKKGFDRLSDGKFRAGSVPWCKTKGGREEYVKTLKGGNLGSFSKGHIPHNTKSIGTESFRGDVLYIKTEKGMMPKRRYIWEQCNGKIPKGFIIISVNGNVNEADVNNLRLIDNNILTVLMSNRWHNKGSVIFDTGVKYAILYNLLKRSSDETN